MGEVYVIISGKGGVGKTTSAINIGSTINTLGKEIVIVDANLSTPNIGLHLGSPIVPVTLNHVMTKKIKPEEAIYEHESGTKIMPASLSLDDVKKTDYNKLPDITKRLRKISDYVLLDSAAGLGEEAKASIKSADKIIIITNPEMSAVTDALKTIKMAEEMKKEVIGTVITRHTGESHEMDIPTIKDMLEVPILGIIPEDKAVKESQKIKNAVVYTHPKSKAAKSYNKTAKRILGPEYYKELQEEAEQTVGLFTKVVRKIFGIKK